MPYIKQADRDKVVGGLSWSTSSGYEKEYSLDEVIEELIQHVQTTGWEIDIDEAIDRRKGLLNYICTRLVAGGMEPGECWGYDSISNAHACLQDAADELNRRLMGKYEDMCIEKNGDVKEYENARFKGQK